MLDMPRSKACLRLSSHREYVAIGLVCFHDVGCDPSQWNHMHQASALLASGLQDGHVTCARRADIARARMNDLALSCISHGSEPDITVTMRPQCSTRARHMLTA